MCCTAQGASRRRRAEDHLRALQVPEGSGRTDRQGSHSAAESLQEEVNRLSPAGALMISVFDLFKVGIGPSSSHTTGPMKAAVAFAAALDGPDRARIKGIPLTLLGSLAWTGKGHTTDKAITLGLSGQSPETLDPDKADEIV